MRVLAVSVAPLFPGVVMGGSQRVLMDVVDALAEAGHDVRVLCSQSAGTGSGFMTVHGAVVEPILPLRGAFPAPYQVMPHRLNAAWQVLSEAADWADRAYLHADAIYMRGALGDVPVMRSLHDFVYEEALVSAFTLPATRTVVPSQYLADCVRASAGTVTDVGELNVIPNGIAVPVGRVKPVLPAGVAPRKTGDLLILHPHRLHAEKGIEESMRIAVEVQRRLPDRNVRLLTPEPDRDGSLDDAAITDESVMELARRVGAAGMLEFHRWLSADEMPGYYAAGDVTLCPGRFVEAFGLVPLESVVAGTPAICARVGALREKQGLPGVNLFDYGDVSAAASVIVRVISESPDTGAAAREIGQRYGMAAMKASYIAAITGELPRSTSAHPTGGEGWRLAPWCYVNGDRIYHDYLGRFEKFPLLSAAISEGKVPVSGATAQSIDFTGELNRAITDGFLVRS
jgi:glycosyltransferase involved in cell wall biosynthesis